MNPLRNPPDFSLVRGEPLFQLLRRAHLSDEALMPVRQRVIVLSLLAWLPLLALSALEGHLLASPCRHVNPDSTHAGCSATRTDSAHP